MVSHLLMIDCLETVGINEKIRRLLGESMKSWRVELISGEENLGEVNIRRGIFQGDSLSPLLFVVCVTTYTYIKRCCTRISFCKQGTKSEPSIFYG